MTEKKLTRKANLLINLAFGITISGLLITAVFLYLLAPSRYLTLDVNPSIEISTNRLNQVVAVSGANTDAKELIATAELNGKDLDVVIVELIGRLVKEGYIKENQKNDILLTSGTDKNSQKMLKEVSTKVLNTVKEYKLPVEIFSQGLDVDKTLEESASQNNVSVGKMAVIDRLMAQDETLTAKDFVETRISDILAYAKEKNISLSLLEDKLDTLNEKLPTEDKALEKLEDAIDEEEDKAEDLLDEEKDKAEKLKDEEEDKAEELKEAEEEKAEAAKEAKEKEEDKAEELKEAKEKEEEKAEDIKEAEEEKAEAAKEAKEDAEDKADDLKDNDDDDDDKKADTTVKPAENDKPQVVKENDKPQVAKETEDEEDDD